MAKKNVVFLTGFISEILVKKENECLFIVQIRKNANKFIYPIIQLGEKDLKNMGQIEVGKLVTIKGQVKTMPKTINIPCDDCGTIIENKFIITTIVSNTTIVSASETEEPYINQVVLLGTVCKEKEFKYIKGTKSPVANTKYQIAVNRREPDSADYPWIATFAKQAEEDAKRIGIGSQVLVDGCINTRVNKKECSCANCGNTISVAEPHTEILGVTIEYLNNCIFD